MTGREGGANLDLFPPIPKFGSQKAGWALFPDFGSAVILPALSEVEGSGAPALSLPNGKDPLSLFPTPNFWLLTSKF